MGPLMQLKGALVQDLDAAKRVLTVSVPSHPQGQGGMLAFRVDEGALVATKHHELLKLEQFQIGQRVSVIYSQQPDGVLLAKTVILERGTVATADRPAPR